MDHSNSERDSSEPCLGFSVRDWSQSDMIDFEYLASLGDKGNLTKQGDIARRDDRQIFIDCVEPALERMGLDREKDENRYPRMALRHWLEYKRSEQPDELRPLLPGQVMARGVRLVRVIWVLIGLFVGGGVAAGLLQYGEAKTVNVIWFLIILVGLQAGMVLVSAVAWMLRRTRLAQDLREDLSLLGHLLRPLVHWVTEHARESRVGALSPEMQARAKAQHGAAKAKLSLHGPLYALSVLMLAQWFGIAFNLGAVTSTSLNITGKDLAFGWETSHNEIVAEHVADAVKAVSLPWRWFLGEGVGYPSLEQVRVTRTYEGEAIEQESREDLHSWRWFLIFSVLTYGLLPRVVLLLFVIAATRNSMGRIPLRGDDVVFARMVTEKMEFQGPNVASAPGETPEASALPVNTIPPLGTTKLSITAGGCLLLLHVDLRSLARSPAFDEIAPKLKQTTGWHIERVAEFGSGSTQDAEIMTLVRDGDWQGAAPRIAVLLNGASTPITEDERFLRTLRESAGSHGLIRIGLVGRPGRDQQIRPVRARLLNLWTQKVRGLGDPLMETVILADAEDGKS